MSRWGRTEKVVGTERKSLSPPRVVREGFLKEVKSRDWQMANQLIPQKGGLGEGWRSRQRKGRIQRLEDKDKTQEDECLEDSVRGKG